MSPVSTLIERIRSEYLALPGLKLTTAQARRLWPASDRVFREAIDALVAEGFLHCLNGLTFVAMPRATQPMAKADLTPRDAVSSARCPHCRRANAIRREPVVTGGSVRATFRCLACGRIATLADIPA